MTKTINKDKILIDNPYKIKRNISAWRAIRGIWKNKQGPDPVKWQKQIRKEWERKLP